jgi:hypothetical protein
MIGAIDVFFSKETKRKAGRFAYFSLITGTDNWFFFLLPTGTDY